MAQGSFLDFNISMYVRFHPNDVTQLTAYQVYGCLDMRMHGIPLHSTQKTFWNGGGMMPAKDIAKV